MKNANLTELSKQILVQTIVQWVVTITLPTSLPIAVFLYLKHNSMPILTSLIFWVSIFLGIFLLILYRVTINLIKKSEILEDETMIINAFINVLWEHLPMIPFHNEPTQIPTEEEKNKYWANEVKRMLHEIGGNKKYDYEIDEMIKKIFFPKK